MYDLITPPVVGISVCMSGRSYYRDTYGHDVGLHRETILVSYT